MIRNFVHRDLLSITISRLFAAFGRGLVGVFIPLLMLNNGLVLWHVCAFYAAYALCKLVVNYPSAVLLNRHGARLGLLVGYTATAATMGLLTAFIATGQVWLVALMALAMAAQNSFMWNSEHLHISRVMGESRASRDLAMMTNLDRLIGVLTPLIGGLLVLWVGEAWLVAIGSLIVLVAIVPVWGMDKLAGGHQPVDDFRYSLRRAPWRDLVANAAFNMHTAVGVMAWPIYMAVFVPDFQSIGIISTVAAGIAMVVVHFAAKRADSGRVYQVLVEGTLASSLVHIGRVLASSNPITITAVTAAYDVALGYQANPWTSLYYKKARSGGINYIMSMEIAGDLAYVALWGSLGLIAYFTQGTVFFTVAFTVAAVVAWATLLMRPPAST